MQAPRSGTVGEGAASAHAAAGEGATLRSSLSAFAVILLSCAAPRKDAPVPPAPVSPAPVSPAAPRDFRACGEVVGSRGEAAPARSKVVLLWEVSTGTSDVYTFKYGEALVENGRFCLTLGPPPKEALNDGLFGIALLQHGDALDEVPDGRLTDEVMKGLVSLGMANGHVLVYVAPELGPGHGWLDRFPVGYGCAFVDRSQPSIDQQVPTPTSCDSLVITLHDPEGVQPANWL